MERIDKLIPPLICVVVAALQVRLAVHFKDSLRLWAAGSKQEFLFDVGAFIFLSGIQALLLRSFQRLTSGNGWIAVVIMAGIAIVIVSISVNIAHFLRKQ